MNNNSILCVRARIKSCLEIILELEEQLATMPQADSLLKEFTKLKKTSHILKRLHVEEKDAERIERATSQLLEELQIPLTLETLVPEINNYPQ